MVLIFFFSFLFLSSEKDGECHKPHSRICWILPNCNWKLTPPAAAPPALAASGGPGGTTEGHGLKRNCTDSSKRGTPYCWPDKARRPCRFSVTFCANYQAGRKRSEHQIQTHRCRTISSTHNLSLDKGTNKNLGLDGSALQFPILGYWPSMLPKRITPLNSFFWSIIQCGLGYTT